jgi:hypothetical protein
MQIFSVHSIAVWDCIECVRERERVFFFLVAPFYIAADKEKKTIVLSIRGTLSATDILTDINAVEDTLETQLFGNGHCHSGTVCSLLIPFESTSESLLSLSSSKEEHHDS